MQKKTRLDTRCAANGECGAQVPEGERLRLACEEEQVAEVERRLDSRNGRDGNLKQRLSIAKRPLVGARRTQPVAKRSEERLPFGCSRYPLASRSEVVRTRQRSEICG